ncbi:hypothetical protein QA612_00890 [Evansella sp. AB-P1]|uniref:hypothetical protein n=1 Tax=Evansella sp. AB-P1 TaxID=3037653 RepID=UPI0024201637|nr:hypothetical protein [Evansella sp. AB-P1]MDG5786026.1 hypothetical protein [Evansella sp. AB-P1]
MKKTVVFFASTFTCLFLLTGCFNFSGITIPLGDGNSIKIGGDDGVFSIAVDGEDGYFEFSGSEDGISFSSDEGSLKTYNEIPDHFPSGIPVPNRDDVSAVGSFVTEFSNNEGEGFMLSFKVDSDEADQLLAQYRDYITSNGYEIFEDEHELGNIVLRGQRGNEQMNVAVMGEDEEKVFTVQLVEQKEPTDSDENENE